ncbi:MAG: GAF domain-containing protein [Cyanobacteria bacterium P01_H01_bin.119]
MGQPKTPNPHEKRMVAIGRVLQTLRETDGLDKLVGTTLDFVKAEFEYDLLWIGFYDRVNHRLQGKGHQCKQDLRRLRQTIPLLPGDLMEQVVIQQRPLAVPDLRAESRAGEWTKIAETLNLQGTLIFPIRRRNLCFGVMVLSSERWGISPSSSERATLSLVLGSLAESVYDREQEHQRQTAKRPDQPLLKLLGQLGELTTLEARLLAVVEETQRFVEPDRTNVYWFNPQDRYFWHRLGNRYNSRGRSVSAKSLEAIAVSDIKGFYQALGNGQLVVIGEAQSSLAGGSTGRLMEIAGARSLMAAPIFHQGELLGFLSVEGNDARIWTESEKNQVQGAAQMIGLSMPTSETEAIVQTVKADQMLTATISRSIHGDEDWRKTLDLCSQELCQRFEAAQLFVLLHNPEEGGFELCYQSKPGRSQQLWEPLSDVDWQMLERAQDPIGIEDIETDLKLANWHPVLRDLKVRSLLVCNVSIGQEPEGLLILADKRDRRWSQTESSLVRVVSQQVGLILHQWQLQRQANQQAHLYEAMQWGLRNLQVTFQLDRLEQDTLDHLSKLLRLPAVALISWESDDLSGRVAASLVRSRDFEFNPSVTIPLESDAVVNWALQTDGLLSIEMRDLPDASRQWLMAPNSSKVMAMMLRTAPEHVPTGLLVALERGDRRWSDYQFNLLTLMASQLAWSRRHLHLVESLLTQQESLQSLNWYKQKRFEELHRVLEKNVRRLKELDLRKDALSHQRYQQVSRQLDKLLSSLDPLLDHEAWQLHSEYETIPIVSLLNRLMERANSQIQKRQLWTKVHNDANLTIGGDIQKIEFVLYELLLAACDRAPVGGRIDVWCRPLDQTWIEISITDSGELDAQLLEEIHEGRPEDILAPSTLTAPPGLHFTICQTLMQQMGGEFSLFQLEDDRLLSRVMVPIAVNTPVNRIGK